MSLSSAGGLEPPLWVASEGPEGESWLWLGLFAVDFFSVACSPVHVTTVVISVPAPTMRRHRDVRLTVLLQANAVITSVYKESRGSERKLGHLFRVTQLVSAEPGLEATSVPCPVGLVGMPHLWAAWRSPFAQCPVVCARLSTWPPLTQLCSGVSVVISVLCFSECGDVHGSVLVGVGGEMRTHPSHRKCLLIN